MLPNPDARVTRFELHARSALEVMRALLPEELRDVRVGFTSAPLASAIRTGGGFDPMSRTESQHPMLYTIDRDSNSIVLHRMPIQRARGLHVDDAEHRRLFIGHCLYRAVCEYLGREPWDLLPGHFDHY